MEPRVIRAGNAGPFTLDGTQTFLVGRQEVALIDPGPDVEDHVRALFRALEGAHRVEILLTHGHPDHGGAAGPLGEALGARGRIHALTGPLALAEGDRIATDEGDLIALDTPGHARPHYSFLHEDSRSLFCGDLLLGEGDTTWVGEYAGAVTEYLSSLGRLMGMELGTLYPAHGAPLRDSRRALERFWRHRLTRIEQVATLRRMHPLVDPTELALRLYGPHPPPGIREAAVLSIRAILHHLGEPTSGGWGSEPTTPMEPGRDGLPALPPDSR